jgi:hypothetical protein
MATEISKNSLDLKNYNFEQDRERCVNLPKSAEYSDLFASSVNQVQFSLAPTSRYEGGGSDPQRRGAWGAVQSEADSAEKPLRLL